MAPHRDVPQSTTDYLSSIQQGVPAWVSARAAINAQNSDLRWVGDGPSGVILKGLRVSRRRPPTRVGGGFTRLVAGHRAAERSCGALQPFYDLFPHHAFLNSISRAP